MSDNRCNKTDSQFKKELLESNYNGFEDRIFLIMVRDKLVNLYGEKPGGGLITRLNSVIYKMDKPE